MDWNQLFNDTLNAILIVVVPTLATFAGRYLNEKFSESRYKKFSFLSTLLVQWAEDKLGPTNGEKKLDAAIDKLVELSKGSITREQADVLVRSSYQNFALELENVKKTPVLPVVLDGSVVTSNLSVHGTTKISEKR